MKKFFAALICAILLMTTFSIGMTAFAETYSAGDTIEFGNYPQTKVTDEGTISALDAVEGSWVSCKYYSGTDEEGDDPYTGNMDPSDYMRYKDVMYNGGKYRAVIFDSYRPALTYMTSTEEHSMQSLNGYQTGNVYWFKYEPLKWKVLDADTGLVMCETAIDSQAFNDFVTTKEGIAYSDTGYSHTANDYSASSIRAWLNDDFYKTAFSAGQKNNIENTALDNSPEGSDSVTSSTMDNIYLLSCEEIKNSNYGFVSGEGEDDARIMKGTDYAMAQGLGTESEVTGWWLRTPAEDTLYANVVTTAGTVECTANFNCTYLGVVPAVNLKELKADTEISFGNDDAATTSAAPEKTTAVTSDKNDKKDGILSGFSMSTIIIIILSVILAAAIVVIIILAVKLKKAKKTPPESPEPDNKGKGNTPDNNQHFNTQQNYQPVQQARQPQPQIQPQTGQFGTQPAPVQPQQTQTAQRTQPAVQYQAQPQTQMPKVPQAQPQRPLSIINTGMSGACRRCGKQSGLYEFTVTASGKKAMLCYDCCKELAAKYRNM